MVASTGDKDHVPGSFLINLFTDQGGQGTGHCVFEGVPK